MRDVEAPWPQQLGILPFPLQNALTRPLRTAAARQGRAEFLSLWAGQGVRMARRTKAATDCCAGARNRRRHRRLNGKNDSDGPNESNDRTIRRRDVRRLYMRRCCNVGATITSVHGGDGPPLLLLHGYPQTHVMWHKVAPLLMRDFTIVATDLRGYGDSSKPESGADHAGYSKRAMAQDQVEVMSHLGFERFFVAGHDRGGRVAHRMALDHPAAW
jgi:hypothetical protein